MLPFRCYSVIVHVKMYNFDVHKVVLLKFVMTKLFFAFFPFHFSHLLLSLHKILVYGISYTIS